MEHIVMTLLVRKRPGGNTECPYAVQIAFPRELSPGEMTMLTSARLIHKKGMRTTASETIDSYRPQEWRAADLSEQAEYAAQFGGNPLPWHCVMRSLCMSIHDFPGSGDKDTNNGQVWAGMGTLEKEWKTARKMHQRCEEELDAEWEMNFTGGAGTAQGIAEDREGPTSRWTWGQTVPR
jgi:hypothetical protein